MAVALNRAITVGYQSVDCSHEAAELVALRIVRTSIGEEEVSFLQRALAAAKEARIALMFTQALEAAVGSLEVRRRLEEAMLQQDQAVLGAALEQAKAQGVNRVTIQAAGKQLRQLGIKEELRRLAGSSDEVALKSTIEKALEAGVGGEDVEPSQLRLRELEAAHKQLSEAQEATSLMTALRRAIQVRYRGASVELAEARRAVEFALMNTADLEGCRSQLINNFEAASEQGVATPYVQASKQLLQLEHAELVEAYLRNACKGSDEKVLREAIDQASLHGASTSAILRVRARLQSVSALRALEGVLDTTDQSVLAVALQAARDAGCSDADDVLLAAQQRLAEFRAGFAPPPRGAEAATVAAAPAQGDGWLETASTRLQKACGGTDENALRAAILKAGEAGTDPAAVAAAKERLRALCAMRLLRDAMATRDATAIRAAVQAAEEVACDPSLLAQARERLAQLRPGPPPSATPEHLGAQPAFVSNGAPPPPPPPAQEQALPATGSRAGAGPKGEMKDWALSMLEVMLVKSIKEKAIADENFVLANEAKKLQDTVEATLRVAKERCAVASAFSMTRQEATEKLDSVRERKRQAIEREDFAAAASLKEEEAKLEQHVASAGAGGSAESNAAKLALSLLGSVDQQDT